MQLVSEGGGAGGVTPLYQPYRYMRPHRVGFLRRFGLTTGIHFAYKSRSHQEFPGVGGGGGGGGGHFGHRLVDKKTNLYAFDTLKSYFSF